MRGFPVGWWWARVVALWLTVLRCARVVGSDARRPLHLGHVGPGGALVPPGMVWGSWLAAALLAERQSWRRQVCVLLQGKGGNAVRHLLGSACAGRRGVWAA